MSDSVTRVRRSIGMTKRELEFNYQHGSQAFRDALDSLKKEMLTGMYITIDGKARLVSDEEAKRHIAMMLVEKCNAKK